MPAPTFIQTAAIQQAMRQAAAAPAAAAPQARGADSGLSFQSAFDDLLDIVNPLQHLPVVGTLYRAITGDKIGTGAKIAGDALYGGLWGAVGAVADTAFQAVTGKDFGATVLAFAEDSLGFGHKDQAPVQVAANLSKPPPGEGADVLALGDALASRGVDTELASRALDAYRRSKSLVPVSLN